MNYVKRFWHYLIIEPFKWLFYCCFQPTTFSRVYTYSGHSSQVRAVAWSPDGSRIASASDDKTVQVWNAG